MPEITKTEAVGMIVKLAKEVEINENIDWSSISITEDEAYETMASNVIEQMLTLPNDQRETVSLATMTKLLVENLVLRVKLNSNAQKETTNENIQV